MLQSFLSLNCDEEMGKGGFLTFVSIKLPLEFIIYFYYMKKTWLIQVTMLLSLRGRKRFCVLTIFSFQKRTVGRNVNRSFILRIILKYVILTITKTWFAVSNITAQHAIF